MKRLIAAALVLTAAAGCGPTISATPAPNQIGVLPSVPPSPLQTASLTPRSSLTLADAASCAVTMPGPAPETFSRLLFGGASAYGNDELWVGGLGPDGVILVDHRFLNPDGSISWKLGWYRLAAGALSISGRRLDAEAAPLRPTVPDGYGSFGFQASGVDFPTEGCWQITGTVGTASLTFVVFVLRTE